MSIWNIAIQRDELIGSTPALERVFGKNLMVRPVETILHVSLLISTNQDLKTPFERALNDTKWKEYFSGGRKYYYNTETKESKWDMPDELLLLLEKVEKEGKPSPATATANGPALLTGPGESSETATPNQTNGTDTAVGPHTGGLPFASGNILPARPNLPDDPVIPHNGFPTVEEGEKAFTHLLRKAGVDANWTWDQTMRAIITDPLYKALNTLAEKKACYQKYTEGLKAKEQEEREARLSKLRPALKNMLKGNPNVFHYTTFSTADKLFSQHPIWQQARIEAERKLVFEEYVTELKDREVQEARASRVRGISKVVTLFKQLNVDVVTRWRQAHNMLTESEEWVQDGELQKLPTLDILLAFEDYSRVREREYEEQTRRAQVEKARKERKAREGFRALLDGLVKEGKIKARTKWKDVYPLFNKDERYLNILGQPGSNPLELFWDAVDVMDQKLDGMIVVVEQAIVRYLQKKQGGDENGEGEGENGEEGTKVDIKTFVTPELTEEEFLKALEEEKDEAVLALSEENLHLIFETLHQQAVKRQADEKRRAERKQRHLQDDLRYALKKLTEPIDINMSYEEVVPLIENLPEYKALEDEDGRRAAFAKFVKRQKERLREASEDGNSITSRKRKEPARDRDEKDREWDRDKDRDREREKEHERSSRHHRSVEDFDHYTHRSSRDHGRERERDRERDGERERGREKDGYRSRHYREEDKEDRKRRSAKAGEWEDSPRGKTIPRERSSSFHREERRDYEMDDGRAEKRPRYDDKPSDSMEVDQAPAKVERAETPEEGEI
ncbi:hypothetical protein ONZ45_g8873 [Pleurotus djamor]|nr:hypothetical protein ONZ45_g8873 [Pleurotus djamor]